MKKTARSPGETPATFPMYPNRTPRARRNPELCERFSAGKSRSVDFPPGFGYMGNNRGGPARRHFYPTSNQRRTMEKHLLLTIGDDRSTSSSLRFLKVFFDFNSPIRLTLFYVAQKNAFSGGCDSAGLSRAESSLRKAKRDLVDVLNLDPDKIDIKAVSSKRGTVRDITAEARAGMYDAVILGRRGISWLEELFESSVTHSILWESIDFPIWVCRKPLEKSRKNVLLCVDGSDECLRMADHVGFMLQDQKQHDITIFHIKVKGEDEEAVASCQECAMEALTVNGVAKERISTKVVTTGNPIKAIVDEAKKGNYAVTAIGRRNRKSGDTKGVLLGFPEHQSAQAA